MNIEDCITIADYLDIKEERKNAINVLKDIIFCLNVERWNWILADHPKYAKDRDENLKRINQEIIYRMQDYDSIMCDFSQDLDLNYQDYGFSKVYKE